VLVVPIPTVPVATPTVPVSVPIPVPVPTATVPVPTTSDGQFTGQFWVLGCQGRSSIQRQGTKTRGVEQWCYSEHIKL
jgi:hypothetical protein